MRITGLTALLVAAALSTACQKKQADQNIVITDNVPDNADIETLPPDESSETPSNELTNGDDSADVTDLNAANNTF